MTRTLVLAAALAITATTAQAAVTCQFEDSRIWKELVVAGDKGVLTWSLGDRTQSDIYVCNENSHGIHCAVVKDSGVDRIFNINSMTIGVVGAAFDRSPALSALSAISSDFNEVLISIRS